MSQPNKSFIYKEYTPYIPEAGRHLTVESRPFDADAPPPQGGITVKNLYLSLDPYQRGQMRGPNDEGTYSIPWVLGDPAVITTLSSVLKSDDARFEPGDLVFGMAPAAEYTAITKEYVAQSRVIPPMPGVDLNATSGINGATLVGALGIAGLSAYESFHEFVKEPRQGKTMFVNAASGAVGQIVGQIGKMYGMKVIGSTGSQEKVDFVVNELGFDGAWNYKTEKTANALQRLAPEGIDVLYDNVGAEQLEQGLLKMKDFGVVIISGMIADYNYPWEEKYGVKTLMQVIFKRLTINGFVCSDAPLLGKYYEQFPVDMVKWLSEGKIKTRNHVMKGIDQAPKAMEMMFKGDKFGKMAIQVDHS